MCQETRFQRGIARHAARLKGQDGRLVDYHNGSGATLEGIAATPMDETDRVSDGDGGFTSIEFTDWLIAIVDLIGTKPMPGHQISFIVGSEKHIYEVMPIEKMPCFKVYDTDNKLFLIHTKRVQ